MAEKPTEQTYASDLKEWINQIIREDNLPFSQAKVEIIKEKKRADILVYDRSNNCNLIIEVKRPEDSPSDPQVVKQAYGYAQNYRKAGLKCFSTHNVNFLILWDAITTKKTDQFSVTYVKQLEDYARKKDEIKESFRKILRWYVKFLEGEPPKPIDESIIEILHSYIQGIVSSTGIVSEQIEQYTKDTNYRKKFETWLLDKGWEDPKGNRQKLEEYCIILAKQFLYIFMNKILFYNVLKEKYPRELPSLELPKGLTSANFFTFLETYFQIAIKSSQDYETVFQTDFVDSIPIPDDTIAELVKVTVYLSTLEYSNIGYDIIGKVFEKLIPQEEKHTLGQYFTRSDVVDLILSFCVKDDNVKILDPACGSGTFLVRAYYRLKYLNGKKTHDELLKQLWGVDIDKFPAHLATINLAIRDLSAKENYPDIIYKDFFDIPGPKTTIRIGMQPTLTSWVGEEVKPKVAVQGLDTKIFEKEIPIMDCVVGNPPYTRQEEMGAELFGEKYKEKLLRVIKSDFPSITLPSRSSIYAYFFPHGARFLQDGTRLGFVCLRSWLDTSYGAELQKFFLEHFKVITVIESKEERWFPDAQMLPCITILEVCNKDKERKENLVKFVQLKAPLSEFVPVITDERDMVQEIHRWKQIDEFTKLVENAEKNLNFKTINFLGKEINLYEDKRIRIVTIKQDYLKEDTKWGKYLGAPSVFFKMLERASQFVVELDPNAAKVIRGITTGANEFFTFPNKFFKIKEEKDVIALIDRATKKEAFKVKKAHVRPVVVKIKPHRQIRLLKSDGYILMLHKSKGELEKEKEDRVLRYIDYGEKKELISTKGKTKGRRVIGYQNLTTIKNRKQTRAWYDLGIRDTPPIIFPGIFWARYIVFFNDSIDAYATDSMVEVHPIRTEDAKVLCALLNSTLTAFLVEYSGRYIENRDRTISNQIKVFEIKRLPIIDPTRIGHDIRDKLEKALDKLIDKEIGLRALYDPRDMADKEELDRIVFCDILGLTDEEMKEARKGLAEIVRHRIERFQATQKVEAVAIPR